MKIDTTLSRLNATSWLATTMGINFLSTPDPDTVEATMTVDGRTCQPFGVLAGGSSLAMAETLAGVGSHTLRPEVMNVGVSVSANHLHTAAMGHRLRATARIVHKGRSLHVWNVDIRDEQTGKAVSTVRVTNMILQS